MDRLAASRLQNFIETGSHLRLHICHVAAWPMCAAVDSSMAGYRISADCCNIEYVWSSSIFYTYCHYFTTMTLHRGVRCTLYCVQRNKLVIVLSNCWNFFKGFAENCCTKHDILTLNWHFDTPTLTWTFCFPLLKFWQKLKIHNFLWK